MYTALKATDKAMKQHNGLLVITSITCAACCDQLCCAVLCPL